MREQLFRLRPWERHSLVLAVLGAVYVLIGSTYMIVEQSPIRQSSLQLQTAILPMAGWGAVWVIVGLLGVLSSRWPPASETWGYTAMSALAALWGSFYCFGVLLGGPPQALTGGLVWAMVAFLWWAIAGLKNPDRVRERHGD